MKKKVLLFTSSFMDIYKDVINCLCIKGYEVTYIQASTIPNNPFNKTLGYYSQKNIKNHMVTAQKMWKEKLQDEKYSQPYDFFLAINGLDVHPYMFNFFRQKNPNIRMVLYMYDRVEGVIQIDEFFQYYDAVFTFDKYDSVHFGINFLPIYWVPKDIYGEKEYDIFGFASYSELKPERTELYKKVKQIIDDNNLKGFIKLYKHTTFEQSASFIVKQIIKRALNRELLSLSDLKSGLFTNKMIAPTEYRDLISKSSVILDSQANYQDGLTARFMWALGYGKKILTTNENVIQYQFYDKNQIMILNDNYYNIVDFVYTPFVVKDSNKKMIEPFRIDRWLDTLLCVDV